MQLKALKLYVHEIQLALFKKSDSNSQYFKLRTLCKNMMTFYFACKNVKANFSVFYSVFFVTFNFQQSRIKHYKTERVLK